MVLFAAATFAVLMLAVPPIAQDQAYHRFADARTLVAGIPNTLNVLSNLAFLAAGVAGLVALRARGTRDADLATFFIGTILTAFGSSWYHLAPSDERLVYDRLGMVVCFAAIVSLLAAERLDVRSRWLLPLLLVLGVASIVWWRTTGDLRPYGFAQFFPMLVIVILLTITRSRWTHTSAFVAVAVLYVLAKLFETFDAPIFAALGVSGHTLKHVAAGCAAGAVAWWVARRTSLLPHDAAVDLPARLE